MDTIERKAILRDLPGRIGERVHFEPTLRCEFGRNIIIGNDFYANFDRVMPDGVAPGPRGVRALSGRPPTPLAST